MNNLSQAPVVIGGVGGSGTRIVARIVRRAGYFLGTNVTGAEDAIEFWEFYDRWINRYLLSKEVSLSIEERNLMDKDWDERVARHRLVIPEPESLWGWKNPRSIFLLPYLHEKYSGMKFIHVVRDGRDMAFSPTAQDQFRMHGAALLRENKGALPIKTAAFWSRINLAAAQYAEDNLRDKYLLVKFEALCRMACETAQQILSFLGKNTLDADQIAAEYIEPPTTIDRWRKPEHVDLRTALETEAESALRKFGYI